MNQSINPLQVCVFEVNLNLATIPASRVWQIPLGSPPLPIYQIPVSRNVLIKRIEVGFDMGVVGANQNILISNWGLNFALVNQNGAVMTPNRGRLFNAVAGVFQAIPATETILGFSQNSPSINFENGLVGGGLQLSGGCQFVLSNTTTTLPANARFYLNIYFQDAFANV